MAPKLVVGVVLVLSTLSAKAFAKVVLHNGGTHRLGSWGGSLETENVVQVDSNEEMFKNLVQRFIPRNGNQNIAADLEVVLNSGPVLSPDVLLNAINLMPDKTDRLNVLNSSGSDKNGTMQRDLSEIVGFTPLLNRRKEVNDPDKNETKNAFLDDENFSGQNPGHDYIKLNATTGGFRFNFSQDAKYLVVSPEAKSRLVLTCAEIDLRNCSIGPEDTLVVNSVGDLRFGRNSFLYCGSAVKVRVVSIRRKISIRIRRDLGVKGEMECKFFARKQRFLEDDEHSCGKLGEGRASAGGRIVGGKRVAPGLFPYLAQLDMTKSSGIHTTCSGSLISKSWVLTAAHCLRGVEAISVFLGGTDRREFNGNEMIVQAEKYVLHKSWNAKTLLGDIALVKLSKPVKYTTEISSVCLPDKKLRNENLLGKKGVAVGWGRLSTTERAPRKAYRVKLPFLSDLRCFLSYPRFFRPKVMMCTESSEERAICYGDSGGPLLYLRNQRVYQVGISSYSSSQVCGESFDVFTRLDDSYVEWIHKRIEE